MILSHVIAELEEWFINNPTQGIGPLNLILKKSVDAGNELPDSLTEAVKIYTSDILNAVMFPREERMWVTKWKHLSCDLPEKLVHVYEQCDIVTFPLFSVSINSTHYFMSVRTKLQPTEVDKDFILIHNISCTT